MNSISIRIGSGSALWLAPWLLSQRREVHLVIRLNQLTSRGRGVPESVPVVSENPSDVRRGLKRRTRRLHSAHDRRWPVSVFARVLRRLGESAAKGCYRVSKRGSPLVCRRLHSIGPTRMLRSRDCEAIVATHGKGYVGSAYGGTNLLGRWLGYVIPSKYLCVAQSDSGASRLAQHFRV